MRLYISGPISGTVDYPERFAEAELRLRAAGHYAYNPAAHQLPYTKNSYVDYMRRDINVILTIEGICLLRGWENSEGAQTELAVARSIGLPVRAIEGWEKHHNIPAPDIPVPDITDQAEPVPAVELDKNTMYVPTPDPELTKRLRDLAGIETAHTEKIVELDVPKITRPPAPTHPPAAERCIHHWVFVDTLPPIKECIECGDTIRIGA